jgi:hypothetical protein
VSRSKGVQGLPVGFLSRGVWSSKEKSKTLTLVAKSNDLKNKSKHISL